MKSTYCGSCGKYVKREEEMKLLACDECGKDHHPECSGDFSRGYGEYPEESEYSICQKCMDKNIKL